MCKETDFYFILIFFLLRNVCGKIEILRYVYVKVLSLCALRMVFFELRGVKVISRIYIMLWQRCTHTYTHTHDDYKMTVFLYLLLLGKLKNIGTSNFPREIVLVQRT